MEHFGGIEDSQNENIWADIKYSIYDVTVIFNFRNLFDDKADGE